MLTLEMVVRIFLAFFMQYNNYIYQKVSRKKVIIGLEQHFIFVGLLTLLRKA